jgi:hypothetical protein
MQNLDETIAIADEIDARIRTPARRADRMLT